MLSKELLEMMSKEELIQMVMDLQKDSLTGTYKREVMNQVKKDLYTVAFIDANNLKTINDTEGHEAGDLYIKSVADSIKSNIRRGDVVIRYGGDEFIIIFENCSIENARIAVSRIKNAAIGIGQADTLDKAVVLADKNMYINKALEKGGC